MYMYVCVYIHISLALSLFLLPSLSQGDGLIPVDTALMEGCGTVGTHSEKSSLRAFMQ